MNNKTFYYNNLFKNDTDLLRGLCIALMNKGLLTCEDIEKGVIQRKQAQEQCDAMVRDING